MNAKDAIVQVLSSAERVVNAYLSELSDTDLLIRPVPGQNHIAWQLGHLIASERSMVESMKPGSCPPLPAEFLAAHGRDEAAVASDDASKFLSKQAYLDLWKTQRAATLAYVDSLSESDLDAPSPERMRARIPTVGGVLLLAGTHVIMHSGQFVSVRRKLGKPIAI
jgi:DinB superfamily